MEKNIKTRIAIIGWLFCLVTVYMFGQDVCMYTQWNLAFQIFQTVSIF
jgi:hypothetical protein